MQTQRCSFDENAFHFIVPRERAPLLLHFQMDVTAVLPLSTELSLLLHALSNNAITNAVILRR